MKEYLVKQEAMDKKEDDKKKLLDERERIRKLLELEEQTGKDAPNEETPS